MSNLKVTEEINHFTGKSRFICVTLDGEEASDYFDTESEALKELGDLKKQEYAAIRLQGALVVKNKIDIAKLGRV